MAAVRSKGNKATELKMVAILRAGGITGWRRHQGLLGRPDFVFRRQRLAVFIDGCFWHGCPNHCRMPKTNTEYWNPKIAGNKRRDREVTVALRAKGWRICRLWEHELKTPDQIAAHLRLLLACGFTEAST
jgi:DNA mismatch endonuclease (patch repair protein)